MIDKYLENTNDFFKLDFIAQLLSGVSNGNAQDIVIYSSLIELILLNDKSKSISKEFREKASVFLNDEFYDVKLDKTEFAMELYNIRSKLVHGDYENYKELLYKFERKYCKNSIYDFGEYKEEIWVLFSVIFAYKRIGK